MNSCMRVTASIVSAILAGCSVSGPTTESGTLLPQAVSPNVRQRATTTPIQHVVILIQENRSFDNLFATFPGADGSTHGFESNGQRVTVTESNLVGPDIGHGYKAFTIEYDHGKMDGFNNDPTGPHNLPAGAIPYHYVNPAQIAPYWTLAHQYVLADHMFPTMFSGSFTAHQDLIAGATEIDDKASIIDDPTHSPWGCDAPANTVTSLFTSTGHYLADKGPFPCFKYGTMRDLLDAAGVSWKYYAPYDSGKNFGIFWSAFDAIAAVRHGPEWASNVLSPETKVLDDVSAGRLPSVAWVVPDRINSDHPGGTSDTGPSWVAQVVNAIGESKYWKSTAIVLLWDDWGGFYDNAKPPQIHYFGLGFRVPTIVISPYAKTGYVSHTQYEFGSILKFVEQNWSLDSLGTTDATATSISNCFDFAKPPRRFAPIAAKYSRAFFERQKPSGLPVDE